MIVYLGLGSNLDDRVGAIQQAISILTDHPNIRLLTASSFYETEPVGNPNQPWFVNAAVAIETSLPPEDLLTYCLGIERQLGRNRQDEAKNSPRKIDIDILFYGNLVVNTDSLVIPHPEAHLRAFVLVPLLEVNDQLIHPIFQKSIEHLHQALAEPEEVFLYGTRRP